MAILEGVWTNAAMTYFCHIFLNSVFFFGGMYQFAEHETEYVYEVENKCLMTQTCTPGYRFN